MLFTGKGEIGSQASVAHSARFSISGLKPIASSSYIIYNFQFVQHYLISFQKSKFHSCDQERVSQMRSQNIRESTADQRFMIQWGVPDSGSHGRR